MNILATADTSFFTIILFIVGATLAIILTILTIMMPVYVYRIYRQGVVRKKAEDIKQSTLTAILSALQLANKGSYNG